MVLGEEPDTAAPVPILRCSPLLKRVLVEKAASPSPSSSLFYKITFIIQYPKCSLIYYNKFKPPILSEKNPVLPKISITSEGRSFPVVTFASEFIAFPAHLFISLMLFLF